MGRRGIRHSKNRNKKPQSKQQQYDRQPGKGAGYKEAVRESKLFESFYAAQTEICPAEEFPAMIESLKTPLQASFRCTGFRSEAVALRDFIESHYFRELTHLAELQDEKKPSAEEGSDPAFEPVRPKCLPWYPDRMAWQLNLTRRDIRREEIYFKLHNFLISETESGNISRQETVSMIPPLVLDVQPHHKVLDMCAAPGSKTTQLIEALHAQEGVIPEGIVIANDADNARCYMLVHQVKRLQSPCLIVTNHDASAMPNIKVTDPISGGKMNLKFDRILCDVPCTGDGTLRKNADIWAKWNCANAANLHSVQYRIAKRGIECLTVGGRLVYSTCSLSPMEDEAVLCRLLAETGDSVELVEASHLVPNLKFTRGVSKWVVGNKEGDIFKTWDEVPERNYSLLRPSMFPPPPEVAAGYHLERCMRILPHLQDTGGFFVAVLEKKKLCPWESPKYVGENPASGEANDANGNGKSNGKSSREPPKKKPRFMGYKEDPFLYFEDNEPVFNEIRDYFGLKTLESKMFLTRCIDPTKKNSIYFSSLLVRDIVTSNVDTIKIINTGVKAFVKCENKGAVCQFRLAQEGAIITIPFLGNRVVKTTKKDLEIMLSFCDFNNPPELKMLEPETQEAFAAVDTGSVAMTYKDKELNIGLVGWKGKLSIRPYVPKNERLHYLRLIGADTTPFETNKFQAMRENENVPDGAGDEGAHQDEIEAKEEIENTNEEADPMEPMTN